MMSTQRNTSKTHAGSPGRVAAGVILAVWLGITGLAPVHAQVTVDQMEVEFPAAAAPQTRLVTVLNGTTERIQADVVIEDWNRTEYGENAWFERGALPQSCRDRLRVFPEALVLAPGATTDLRLTMNPSEDDNARECWSAVMIETSRTGKDGNLYVLRTAVKAYGLPRTETRNGIVQDLRILPYSNWAEEVAAALGRTLTSDQQAFLAGRADSLVMEVVFDNTGSRHLRAEGRIEFRRPDGGVEAALELPDLYVLPGARRRVQAGLPSLPAGQYAVLAIVDYGGDELTAMQMDYHAPAP